MYSLRCPPSARLNLGGLNGAAAPLPPEVTELPPALLFVPPANIARSLSAGGGCKRRLACGQVLRPREGARGEVVTVHLAGRRGGQQKRHGRREPRHV
mmetsp:Transcript_19057/g.54696  ORF Transcript_19057/g.54696 Transcript_19057/m.54696 type:complete len:98 (-) Transcript_19057:29-322(-)